MAAHRLLVTVMVFAFLSVPIANAKAPQPAGTPPFQPQWSKDCRKYGRMQVCVTGIALRTDANELVAVAGLIESVAPAELIDSDLRRKKILKVFLPGPLQVQHGVRIIVDQQPPLSTSLLICRSTGCQASFEATLDLISQLKNGQLLTIEATNISGTPISVALPLTGFASTYEERPTDPKEFDPQHREYWKKRKLAPRPDVVL